MTLTVPTPTPAYCPRASLSIQNKGHTQESEKLGDVPVSTGTGGNPTDQSSLDAEKRSAQKGILAV